MSTIPFSCIVELISSAYSGVCSEHSVRSYTNEPSNGKSRTWRTAGFYSCIDNDRRLVLEALEDSNIHTHHRASLFRESS